MVRPRGADPPSPPPIVGRQIELDVVVATAEQRGQVLVTGEPGIGKSALLRACADALARQGFRCFLATATPGLSDQPLAGIGHLLGALGERVPATSPPELGRLAVEALHGVAPGSSAMLVLDDAHHLDRWSLHAVLQARAAGGPRVLAAARSTEPLPDAVLAFGRAPGARIELQRLSRDETAELAVEVLGAPLDTPGADRLHAATDGLPLAITEVLDHARRTHALVERSGLWRWDRSAPPDRHLGELLGLRIDALQPDERDVVDVLSVVDRLPIVVVEGFAPGVDLADMEDRRLVGAFHEGWVAPAHPLLRDAALGALAPLRRRHLLVRLVDTLTRHVAGLGVPADAGELDRIRVQLAVEIGADVPVEVLVDVAEYGRAHGLWDRLGPVMARAWDVSPSPTTGLAYGESLYWTRRMDDAARVLEETLARCTDPVDLVRVTLARARTLHIGLGDRDAAGAARAEILTCTDDPALRLEILAAEADELLFLGDIEAIVRTWAAHPVPPVDGPLAAPRYRLTQSSIGALGLAGRMADMTAEYEWHLAASRIHGERHPLAAVAVGPWWAASNVLGGRSSTVGDLIATEYRASNERDDRLTRSVWALPAAIERWVAGDLLTAELLAREALGIDASVLSIRRIATHFLIRILQLQGRDQEALALCDGAAGDDYVELVRGWSAALEAISREHVDPAAPLGRRHDRTVTAVADVGRQIAERGQVVASAYVHHDLLRLGAADAAADGLADLAPHTDAPTVAWMLGHARAVRDRSSAPALAELATEAAEAGHVTLARQMLDDAVAIAAAGHDGPLAHRLSDLAEQFARGTTGWPVAEQDRLVDLGLTARETEVARAVAAGLTDRHVAEALGLSVRTVNAHLRSVYRKLGIAGRPDLRELLRPDGPERAPTSSPT